MRIGLVLALLTAAPAAAQEIPEGAFEALFESVEADRIAGTRRFAEDFRLEPWPRPLLLKLDGPIPIPPRAVARLWDRGLGFYSCLDPCDPIGVEVLTIQSVLRGDAGSYSFTIEKRGRNSELDGPITSWLLRSGYLVRRQGDGWTASGSGLTYAAHGGPDPRRNR